MTTTHPIAVSDEVAAITSALAAKRDPTYEWGMRRTVPSAQPVHTTRVPDIRRVAADWRRTHRGAPPLDVIATCESLWATGWREERIVAIDIIEHNHVALATVEWPMLERWSADIDNWELVDHLASITGRLLTSDPALLLQTKALASAANPWQRRLALVTLIVAFRRDAVWRAELEALANLLGRDPHPLVRRAVVWARDRLKKDHLDD